MAAVILMILSTSVTGLNGIPLKVLVAFFIYHVAIVASIHEQLY